MLADWSLESHPQIGGPVLRGQVFDHPLIDAGTVINTSHVALVDPVGHAWARTISRYYRLGRHAGATLH